MSRCYFPHVHYTLLSLCWLRVACSKLRNSCSYMIWPITVILHFTFCIPHSAVPYFTHSQGWNVTTRWQLPLYDPCGMRSSNYVATTSVLLYLLYQLVNSTMMNMHVCLAFHREKSQTRFDASVSEYRKSSDIWLAFEITSVNSAVFFWWRWTGKKGIWNTDVRRPMLL